MKQRIEYVLLGPRPLPHVLRYDTANRSGPGMLPEQKEHLRHPQISYQAALRAPEEAVAVGQDCHWPRMPLPESLRLITQSRSLCHRRNAPVLELGWML